MYKEVGWVLRCWTETSENGWTSYFERYATEAEATKHGMMHNRLINTGELSREFEVYKDFVEV